MTPGDKVVSCHCAEVEGVIVDAADGMIQVRFVPYGHRTVMEVWSDDPARDWRLQAAILDAAREEEAGR